ncbi:hypothetical protein Mapa_017080 [Marchantia paleacea]|nr:hypothetical protein Mapa_017080 [Marchantia paleacea]
MEPDWYDEILLHLDQEKEDGSKVRIYRVPIYMKDRSPDDFRPLELFVGFYTHPSLVLDQDPMHLDISKLAVAQKICQGPEPDSPPIMPAPSRRPTEMQKWRDFVSHLQSDLNLAREMYDRLTVDVSGNAVVALDSLFIVAYLRFNYSWADTWGYDFAAVFERSRFNASRFPVLHDLLMLENQVPMLLLEAVVKYLCKSPTDATAELYDMLEWFVMEVYPFNHGAKLDVNPDELRLYLSKIHKNSFDSFVKCDHLLHCAYLAICGPHNPSPDETPEFCGQFLPCFKPRNIAPTDVVPARNRFRIPSATSLRRVGISVKVRDNSLTMNNIQFERHRHNAETVCKQWNQMCDGLYIPSSTPEYWSHIQDRINELEKSKSNRWFAEIEERNFSSFVLFVSFVAFTIIFFSTLVQAIFSVLAYGSIP